jgi:hypothetical protein
MLPVKSFEQGFSAPKAEIKKTIFILLHVNKIKQLTVTARFILFTHAL